jgi:hypothetical protein
VLHCHYTILVISSSTSSFRAKPWHFERNLVISSETLSFRAKLAISSETLSFRAKPCHFERSLVISSAPLSFRALPCHFERSLVISSEARNLKPQTRISRSLALPRNDKMDLRLEREELVTHCSSPCLLLSCRFPPLQFVFSIQ